MLLCNSESCQTASQTGIRSALETSAGCLSLPSGVSRTPLPTRRRRRQKKDRRAPRGSNPHPRLPAVGDQSIAGDWAAPPTTQACARRAHLSAGCPGLEPGPAGLEAAVPPVTPTPVGPRACAAEASASGVRAAPGGCGRRAAGCRGGPPAFGGAGSCCPSSPRCRRHVLLPAECCCPGPKVPRGRGRSRPHAGAQAGGPRLVRT